MSKILKYLQEVEAARSEVDKLAVMTHTKNVKDYPVADNGVFSRRTTKDASRRADMQDGADKAAYEAAQGSRMEMKSYIMSLMSKQASMEESSISDVASGKKTWKQHTADNDAIIKDRKNWPSRKEPYMKKTVKESIEESTEELDEVSKGRLGDYIKKASHDVATRSAAVSRYAERAHRVDDEKKKGDYSNAQQGRKDHNTAERIFKKSWKRREGIAKAVDKITKESVELDEVSTERKADYAARAIDQIKSVSDRVKSRMDRHGALTTKDKADHDKMQDRKKHVGKILSKAGIREETEELDEVSRKRLNDYIQGANSQIKKVLTPQVAKSQALLGKKNKTSDEVKGVVGDMDKSMPLVNKRLAGMKKAVDKLKESYSSDDAIRDIMNRKADLD